MSTGQMQVRNAQNVRLLSGDFQLRYEPNFAWKSACSAFLALPALRAFWPMSSVDYTAASRARDISGGGYHLADNNTVEFGYDNLAPYVHLTATSSEYLSRVDGGAANWADVTGTEVFLETAYRGLTVGGWFYFDGVAGVNAEDCITKYDISGGANQRSYLLLRSNAGTGGFGQFAISSAGTGATTVVVTSTEVMGATTWYFFCGRFDPSTELAVFVNAVQTTNVVAIPATIFDSTADFYIGAQSAVPSNFLDGRASMCFLCAAYLSDAIILSLYEQTRAMYGV